MTTTTNDRGKEALETAIYLQLTTLILTTK